ncbi:AAA family ATPase [Kocuria sp. SL71]|uniref:AAA family ATPase n=1 Tax=Kocuria sp. SL71 TaxID=2995151 RepID=UPI002274AFE3|nr:ATP-binding protein [Kocuria sp. SL71]MCY1683626.1 ATP-binding protein [Kocuria sp. SL71]
MILLSFTVRNHASVRDEITLDLTHPSLRTLQPKGSDWSRASYPLAGIFGGNATGKSQVLDALRYVFAAIERSATSWQASKSVHRAPFLLDGTARSSSSTYELDFVHDGRRHLYGFEVDAEGIKREWMRDVPKSRWRTLLERNRGEGTLNFHASLRGKIEVTPRELVLSRALLLGDTLLHAVAQDLVSHFDAVLVKDSHREERLRDIADSLADKTITFTDIEALLQVADIGVVKVDIEEMNIPEGFRRAILNLKRELRDDEETDEGDNSGDELDPDQLEQVIRHLVFTHRGTIEDSPAFSIQDESDGTIAWLATAVPALEALRQGGLLVVDEIDASLHPHLLELLLGAFADPSVNTEHAQLIFTSHESFVLSPLSEVRLDPEQIWFTDKSYEGVTELTCLSDFPRHPDANVSRRYLTGRYGGTPRLSPSSLAALVQSGKE